MGNQIPGKCITNTLFDLKGHLVHNKYHFPCEYYGLVIKYTKSHHPNQCIKVRAVCLWFILFFCNQTWPGHLVMLSSDFSFLCMSKNCSISVIYSSSNEFIFCIIHFSFTQLHEMLLSLNNKVKQKTSITKQQLPLFDTCSYLTSLVSFKTSIFQNLYFYFVPDCLAIYFQYVYFSNRQL